MTARIAVPGNFVFEGGDVQFEFVDHEGKTTGVLPLKDLMQTPEGHKHLMAVLGVGFQAVQNTYPAKPKASSVGPAASSSLEEIQAEFEASRQQHEEALRNFQESAESSLAAINEAYGGTNESPSTVES